MLNSKNLQRDLATALILGTVAVVLAPALWLRAGRAKSEVPATDEPLQAGTFYKDAPLARNNLAPAALTEADKIEVEPTVEERPAEAPKDRAKSTPVETPVEPKAGLLEGTKRAEAVASPSPPKAQADSPEPNAVEQAPKPVAKMAKEEVQEAIDRYRKWCHEGKIQVVLVTDHLPNEALTRFAECFILQGTSSMIQVLPGGRAEPMSDASRVAGRLAGDLNQRAWPAELVAKAELWFGKANRATACFVLSDESQLLVYRALASGLGDRKLREQTEYRLGLGVNSRTNQLLVKFLEHR